MFRGATRVAGDTEDSVYAALGLPWIPPELREDRGEPYDVDMLKIIRKARARGVFLELNAHPARLDLFDTHCRMARDEGVLVSVNSDAHSVLDFARNGVRSNYLTRVGRLLCATAGALAGPGRITRR